MKTKDYVVVRRSRTGGVHVATLFDPETEEFDSAIIYDCDNPDLYQDVTFPEATEDQKKQARRIVGLIEIGDTVKIVTGRKMVGAEKEVSKMLDYQASSYHSIPYLFFTDGTKVQKKHCKLV